MAPSAEVLLDRVAVVVRQHLPAGVTPSYFDAFLARQRPVLVSVLARHLARRTATTAPSPFDDDSLPPEEWAAARRTRANLAAMELAAANAPESMTDADRAVLAGYSGWGGLSIEKVALQAQRLIMGLMSTIHSALPSSS